MTTSSLSSMTWVWAGENGEWIGGWGGPWWPLIPLVWIAVIALIVWVVTRRRSNLGSPSDRAVDILATRFAKGEISADEYKSRLDQLKGAE